MDDQDPHGKELRALFGARLRSLRAERGWDRKQTAERIECDVTYYCRIENGDRGPAFDLLPHLARAFAVDASDLFCFPETAERHRVSDLLRSAPPDARRRVVEFAIQSLAPRAVDAAGDDEENALPRSRRGHRDR
jgi:transcriptional regulator with XRE-family HTH domain